MGKRIPNLLVRCAIAVLFGPAVLILLYLGGYYMLAILLVISFGLLAEFGTLPSVDFSPIQEGLLITAGLVLQVIAWLDLPIPFGLFFVGFSGVWLLFELANKKIERSLERSAMGVFALFLFGFVPSLAFQLNRIDPIYGVLPMAFVWFCDSMAYFAGKIFKGPKMSPVLSPNKTWAGFFGEILGAIIVAVVFSFVFSGKYAHSIWGFAIPAGFIAVLADLFESKAKREMGIKDTSPSIPGHGGIWDRFDSWLFVQLWAWIYFTTL